MLKSKLNHDISFLWLLFHFTICYIGVQSVCILGVCHLYIFFLKDNGIQEKKKILYLDVCVTITGPIETEGSCKDVSVSLTS
jgi:hypothetical protein